MRVAQMGMGVVTVAAQRGNFNVDVSNHRRRPSLALPAVATAADLPAWLLPVGDRRGRVLADIARLPYPATTTFIGAT